MDEAVNQLSALSQAFGQQGGLGRLKRNATATAELPAVAVLCRQLISDLLIDRLGGVTGRPASRCWTGWPVTCRGRGLANLLVPWLYCGLRLQV